MFPAGKFTKVALAMTPEQRDGLFARSGVHEPFREDGVWSVEGQGFFIVDQVVGTDRPFPARTRHLVGAQDLGPLEEGDVIATLANTGSMPCISRRTFAKTGLRFSTR